MPRAPKAPKVWREPGTFLIHKDGCQGYWADQHRVTWVDAHIDEDEALGLVFAQDDKCFACGQPLRDGYRAVKNLADIPMIKRTG